MLIINIIGAYHSGLRNSCSIFRACYLPQDIVGAVPVRLLLIREESNVHVELVLNDKHLHLCVCHQRNAVCL